MALTPVENPFGVFLGLDGRPLNGGRVYIGVANQDPETNPQGVFWDGAGGIPAIQPLNTLSGYVVNASSPARFWTEQPYSIRVRDRQNNVVFYAASVEFELPDGLVTADSLTDDSAELSAIAVKVGNGIFHTVADLVADSTIIGYSGAKVAVSAGNIVEAAGYRYKVASAIATDEHLVTAGGVKLYVLPIDMCFHAEAFGVVTGDWVTDDPGDKVDSTAAMQAALDALSSRMTLVLPSGTIYTGDLTIPYGTLAVCIVGQGTFIPSTVIQFLPGATNGFQLPHEAYEFKDLNIRGCDEAGSALFTSTRTDGYADQDWSFFNCFFTHADHIGKVNGRGVSVDKCTIGKINDDAFILDHPSADDFIEGPPDYIQTWEGGFRGFTIRGCRIHNFSSHLFRVNGNNKENCRGFTIVGNQSDGYARIIKGYAQEVNFSANNWYIGWNSSDAVLFDLVDCREINIVGNVVSNATDTRQTGDEPLVRVTGNIRGMNITGNTFGRRDVPVLDCGTASNSRSIRDVVIAKNTYNDCIITASFLVRIVGATGLVQGVMIDEMLYESPSGGWTAVVGDTNWRNASIKVRTRHSDTIVHNISNVYSRDNEQKTGSYTGAGASLDCFVGYPPKIVRIYKNDGTLAAAKVQSSLSSGPASITFTATGFTVSGTANTGAQVYYWEAA